MTRQIPRRPSSSRVPVSRPRRVAGQGGLRADQAATEPTVVAPVEIDEEEVEDQVDVDVEVDDQTPAVDPVEAPTAEPARGGMAALFEGRRVTVVLVVLVVVLALATAAVALYSTRGDDGTASAPPPKGQIAVPEGHPVVMSDEQAQQGVAAAAKAATTIVGRSYQDYDKQVAAATALMTDDFAAEYQKTTDDIKDSFVTAKTEVEVRIVAQGVVRANRSQVQALLFLNQYVSKDGGDTTYTPYRALVTVVHTDRGWLVSDLDTQ
jgi:Mce-associated membrane protein